MPWVNKAIISF